MVFPITEIPFYYPQTTSHHIGGWRGLWQGRIHAVLRLLAPARRRCIQGTRRGSQAASTQRTANKI